eukprot:12307272-Alexandrium_andersonii.AAC.1
MFCSMNGLASRRLGRPPLAPKHLSLTVAYRRGRQRASFRRQPRNARALRDAVKHGLGNPAVGLWNGDGRKGPRLVVAGVLEQASG